ncbi:MAG: cytochrome c biogenesis protein CcsA, partial [Flavobacteriaceae bacterium]|nr:cytochrome c biogenesis protein CcsA [Flavobacteriaceae bacterium]
GTEKSYSSFMSKVTVEDESSFDYDIYMNNILNHEGYRFFQASFDPDEKGTVLSVNNDFWGTFITYAGYIFLYVSMLGIFFYGKTRFKNLSNSLKKLNSKGMPLTVFFFFIFSINLNAQDRTFSLGSNFNYDSLIQVNKVSKSHASKFGRILIQDLGGRMKPVNTFSSELIRKVSKRENYKDLNSDQMLISIIQTPVFWYNVPIIFLKRGNDSIRKIIGLEDKEKYASFVSFFDKNGNYKIASQLEEAYRSSVPNQFQKDFIEVDRKVNLLYSALEGKILRFFPVPDNLNNKWVSYQELKDFNFKGRDSLYAYNILPLYFNSLRIAKEDGNYEQPEDLLNSLIGFQRKYGEKIIPSSQKIDAEILYNKVNIFERLFKCYLYASLIFFVLVLVQIFKEAKFLNLVIKILKISTLILFISHTLGLIFRGYISGHAPWSDAYESMIYVSWATLFFGLIFGRRSDLTIASTTFVSSMILMIAHWNWLDPAIANLQPVLDSYWLMIHVAIIVASYGPFALGMIIGSVCLLLMILLNNENRDKLKNKIRELTIINEMSLTVGLIMLTIGNFLGAMWANESWGRYWGWDPKETWALISIMVYAFVIHIRLIPGFRTSWLFNFLSVIAFSSILMTYFGVNFYLVGLHSYASGDKVITPNFIYYSLLVVFILGFLSYFRSKKFL